MSAFTIVVALHDSAADLDRLLTSIDAHLRVRPPVICVDSGSRDDGPARARAWGAEVIVLDGNPGFGAANDAGVARVQTPVTVLLNPDIELLDDGVERLAAMAAAGAGGAGGRGRLGADGTGGRGAGGRGRRGADGTGGHGATGRDALFVPRLLNPDGSVQRSAHPRPGGVDALLPALIHPRALPRSLRERADPWRADRPRPVGWAIAAAIAGRTATLQALGPFDPGAFLFYEDLDLCLRAAAAGVPTELRPEIALRHRGGHSTGTYFGGEPLDLHARRRRAVVGANLGRRALALDDAAQALTFATRALVKGPRGGERERAQLAALRRARHVATPAADAAPPADAGE